MPRVLLQPNKFALARRAGPQRPLAAERSTARLPLGAGFTGRPGEESQPGSWGDARNQGSRMDEGRWHILVRLRGLCGKVSDC